MLRTELPKGPLGLWFTLLSIVEAYSLLLGAGFLPQSAITYWLALVFIVCVSGISGIRIEQYLEPTTGSQEYSRSVAEVYLTYLLPPFIACLALFWQPLLLLSGLTYYLLTRNILLRQRRHPHNKAAFSG